MEAVGAAEQVWRVEVTAPAGLDPVPTWAVVALAVDKQCRLRGARARTRCLTLSPEAGTLVGELQVVAPGPDEDGTTVLADVLADVLAVVSRQAAQRAGRDGTTAVVRRLAGAGDQN